MGSQSKSGFPGSSPRDHTSGPFDTSYSLRNQSLSSNQMHEPCLGVGVCVCGGGVVWKQKHFPLKRYSHPHYCCPLNEKSSSTHSRLEVFCRGPTMSFQLLLLFNEFLLVSVVSFIWAVQSFLWLSSCFLST